MMLPSKPASDGFSLIELLVVISIMAGVMALVGPLTVRSVESARAQTELVSIERWINGWGRKAFLSASVISIKAKNSNLVAEREGQQVDSFDLSMWQPTQALTLQFSASGLPSLSEVELVSGEITRDITIRGDLPRSSID
jgi:prepilin-type N-terminal cleavage/methylation domain-containing protein